MFDAEMIRACAELYPAEFFGLCALAAVMIPIGVILTIAMATTLIDWK